MMYRSNMYAATIANSSLHLFHYNNFFIMLKKSFESPKLLFSKSLDTTRIHLTFKEMIRNFTIRKTAGYANYKNKNDTFTWRPISVQSSKEFFP